jgi:hypothetical protein
MLSTVKPGMKVILGTTKKTDPVDGAPIEVSRPPRRDQRPEAPEPRDPRPDTLNPQPSTCKARNPCERTSWDPPATLDPKPYTLHPALYTPHPTPYILHPAPYTQVLSVDWKGASLELVEPVTTVSGEVTIKRLKVLVEYEYTYVQHVEG